MNRKASPLPAVAVLAGLAVLAALLPFDASAQQLLAWPVGRPPAASLLPGHPIVPLPPQPHPLPRPWPQPAPEQTTPLALSAYSVEGDVEDRAANLTYRITFHNPSGQRMEGVVLVPLPADAVLSGFSMMVGGKEMKGELLDAGQAATIYENIVRQARDPGLLELVGERLFRARVFPIEPNADVAVRLTVTQVLPKSGGLSTLALRAASARLNVRTERPIRTLYSPDPEMRVRRTGERAAEVTLDGGQTAPKNVSLFLSTQEDPLAAGLLSYREAGEDGYFMLSLSPRAEPAAGRAAPKDVVFVVDRSGSMEQDGKMEQTRQALAYCIRRLGAQDRFGIVDFATDWSELEPRLVAADEANKQRALRYVERLDAMGGTNIEAGLGEGLRLLSSSDGRVPMLFFMTDGLPTVGQTDVASLLRQAQERNGVHSRLFTFGVGSDVNTLFLDKLAQGGRGSADYVQPGETIEAKVSALYQKIARPALTDVRLEWDGVDAAQVFPRPVADLFQGQELVVLGRYKKAGKGRLVVTGRSEGAERRFEFPVELPDSSTRLSFLPRLWANAKVGHELDAIRLSGRADPEVIADIVRLAKRFGIVTPYTSMLVTEEGRDLRAVNAAAVSAVRGAAQDAMASGFSGGSGVALRAQKASKMLGQMTAAAAPASAAAFEAVALQEREELKAKGRSVVDTRSVGGKTFYRRGDRWVDGEAELAAGKAAVVKLSFLSAGYFEALGKQPGLAKYLAVGAPLTVSFNGVVYEIDR
jgi:Ca-activated chloride channel family protein